MPPSEKDVRGGMFVENTTVKETVSAPGTRASKSEARSSIDPEDIETDYSSEKDRVLQDAVPEISAKRAKRATPATESTELDAPPAPRLENPFRILAMSQKEHLIMQNGTWVTKDSKTDLEGAGLIDKAEEPQRDTRKEVFTGFSGSAPLSDDLLRDMGAEPLQQRSGPAPSPSGAVPERPPQPLSQNLSKAKPGESIEYNGRVVEVKPDVYDLVNKKKEMHNWWAEKMKEVPGGKTAGGVLGYTPNKRDPYIDDEMMMRQYGPAHRPQNPEQWRIHQSWEHRRKYLPTSPQVPRWYRYSRRGFRLGFLYVFVGAPFAAVYLNSAQMDTSWHYTKVSDFSNQNDRFYDGTRSSRASTAWD